MTKTEFITAEEIPSVDSKGRKFMVLRLTATQFPTPNPTLIKGARYSEQLAIKTKKLYI